MALSVRSPTLTRPTLGAPRRALFPWAMASIVRSSVSMILPSLLVRPSTGWARLLPTARFDEHRLSKNTIDPVCALGEQRKLPSPPIHYFAEPSEDRAMRFHPSREQRSDMGVAPPFLLCALCEHR